MVPSSPRLTLAQIPTPRSVDVWEPRTDERRAGQGIWMEDSTIYLEYGFQTPVQTGFQYELRHCKSHVQDM